MPFQLVVQEAADEHDELVVDHIVYDGYIIVAAVLHGILSHYGFGACLFLACDEADDLGESPNLYFEQFHLCLLVDYVGYVCFPSVNVCSYRFDLE